MDRQLNFGKDYPKRPPAFGWRFIKLLSKCAAIKSIGKLGRLILEEIVMTEDATGFVECPRFWIMSLADRLATNRKYVGQEIQKLIDAGWLHWERTHDREMAYGWVEIPLQYQKLLGGAQAAMVDSELVGHFDSDTLVSQNVPRSASQNVPRSASQNVPRSASPSICPMPMHIPPPPEWEEAGNVVRQAGVNAWAHAVSTCRKHSLNPQDVLAIVTWWHGHLSEFPLNPQGALFFGLCNAHPDNRSDWGKSFPKRATGLQRRLESPGTVSPSIADPKEARDTRLRQLEFQWEEQVVGKSIADISSTFELPEDLASRLAPFQTWHLLKQSRSPIAPDLRIEVLTHVQRRLAS